MSDEDESGDDELDDNLSDEEVEFSDDGEFGPDFKAADDYEDVLDKDEDGEGDFEFEGDDDDDDDDDEDVPQLGFDEEDIEFSDDGNFKDLCENGIFICNLRNLMCWAFINYIWMDPLKNMS